MTIAPPTISGPQDIAPNRTLTLSFEPRSDRLLGLGFVNGVLKAVTLGLYSAWAKTEIRRKLWSFTRLNGEPLEYTGTGRELFLGFLIVFFVIALPLLLSGAAIALLLSDRPGAMPAYQAAVYTFVFALFGNAIYRAQRYRLSRTRWRGIRAALTGSAGHYGWTYFWTVAAPLAVIAALALLTAWGIGPNVGGGIMLVGLIGALWVLPWRANLLNRIMTNDTRFGDQPLTYTGTPWPLYARYLYAWAASAVVLLAAIGTSIAVVTSAGGLDAWRDMTRPPPPSAIAKVAAIWVTAVIAWAVVTASYRAAQIRHFARHTQFSGATFRSTVTGRGMAWLIATNWLLTIFAVVLGAAIGIGLIIAIRTSIVDPQATQLGAAASADLIDIALTILPIILTTSTLGAFAQFRSARYFLSNLNLDGAVDLDAIQQADPQSMKRGEGLAQVFDIDAF